MPSPDKQARHSNNAIPEKPSKQIVSVRRGHDFRMTLIENEVLRKRLAEAGAKFLRERFSIRASAERMGEIYAQLIH